MKIHFKFKQSMAGFLILAMLHLCWMSSFAWAEMVATDALAQSQTEGQNPRQRLLDLLSREEVRKELEKHGISQVETVARVNSLTDEEVAEVVGRLDQLPNGGFVEAFVYSVLLALYLAVYFFGVFFKGLECLFSGCEAKGGLGYVFQPLWNAEGEASEGYEDEPEEECDPEIDSCI